MTERNRYRVTKDIVLKLIQALDAAKLEHCGVAEVHQNAMRIYLNTWVVAPLRSAINEIGADV